MLGGKEGALFPKRLKIEFYYENRILSVSTAFAAHCRHWNSTACPPDTAGIIRKESISVREYKLKVYFSQPTWITTLGVLTSDHRGTPNNNTWGAPLANVAEWYELCIWPPTQWFKTGKTDRGFSKERAPGKLICCGDDLISACHLVELSRGQPVALLLKMLLKPLKTLHLNDLQNKIWPALLYTLTLYANLPVPGPLDCLGVRGQGRDY